MKLFFLFMGILLVLFSTSLVAGTIDPDTPDSKYIEYGSHFTNVVKIFCFDGKGVSSGSAVVIGDHWILTAAHVVENCNSWFIETDNKKHKISNMIIHHKYKTDKFGYDDIALGYIQENMCLNFYTDLYEDSDEVGKLCSIAGWGFTGNFNTGIKFHDRQRRAGSNFIDKTERQTLVCSPSRPTQKSTELEYLIGSGDSGGGLFIDGKLAGIHSSVMAGNDKKPNSSYGDESCHTRVSLYTGWIKQTMIMDKYNND